MGADSGARYYRNLRSEQVQRGEGRVRVYSRARLLGPPEPSRALASHLLRPVRHNLGPPRAGCCECPWVAKLHRCDECVEARPCLVLRARGRQSSVPHEQQKLGQLRHAGVYVAGVRDGGHLPRIRRDHNVVRAICPDTHVLSSLGRDEGQAAFKLEPECQFVIGRQPALDKEPLCLERESGQERVARRAYRTAPGGPRPGWGVHPRRSLCVRAR